MTPEKNLVFLCSETAIETNSLCLLALSGFDSKFLDGQRP